MMFSAYTDDHRSVKIKRGSASGIICILLKENTVKIKWIISLSRGADWSLNNHKYGQSNKGHKAAALGTKPHSNEVGFFHLFPWNTRKVFTRICVNQLPRFVHTTLSWSQLSILTIHHIFFEKETLLLSFPFSVCTFLIRQRKEAY